MKYIDCHHQHSPFRFKLFLCTLTRVSLYVVFLSFRAWSLMVKHWDPLTSPGLMLHPVLVIISVVKLCHRWVMCVGWRCFLCLIWWKKDFRSAIRTKPTKWGEKHKGDVQNDRMVEEKGSASEAPPEIEAVELICLPSCAQWKIYCNITLF